MRPRLAPVSTLLILTLLLLVAGGSSARAQQRPEIVFAEALALLISIDGAPVYRHIPGTDLSRLVNTKALIVETRPAFTT